MGDPCQICGTEPAARLTLLGASDPITIVACVRHRNAIAYDIGQAISSLTTRAETTLRAAPSARAETGAMQFGVDWRGLFIRGDSAYHFALQLSILLERCKAENNFGERFLCWTIAGSLRDLLLSSHQQRTDVEVQMLRPFDECSSERAAHPVHYLGSEMRRACYFDSKGPSPDTLIMTKEIARVTCSECLAKIKGGE